MKISIHELNVKLDKQTKDYLFKKINNLEKYLSDHSKKSVHLELFFNNPKSKKSILYEVEAIMYLPHEVLKIKHHSSEIPASIDEIKDKLKIAVIKYKEIHESHNFKRHYDKDLINESLVTE